MTTKDGLLAIQYLEAVVRMKDGEIKAMEEKLKMREQELVQAKLNLSSIEEQIKKIEWDKNE